MTNNIYHITDSESLIKKFISTSTGNFELYIPAIFKQDVSIEITDAQGQIIFSEIYTPQNGRVLMNKQLLAGIYFVKVFDSMHTQTTRKVKY